MQLFSPSSRQDFSFCPRMWWLRKQGWKLRQITYPELCTMGGSAVSEAMDYWNKRRIATQQVTLGEVVAVGLQSLEVQLATEASLERRVTGLKDSAFKDELPQYVETGIKTMWANDPLAGHTIIASEHTFPEFGNMRCDVVSRDAKGELVVDDYKCKFGEFDVAWTDREFDKHFDGEQRVYYTQATGASLFGIILIIIRPHSKRKAANPHVIRRVSRIQPHEVMLWKNDMVLDCQRMEGVLKEQNVWKVPGKAAPHANAYGDCAYREACVEHNLDVTKMAVKYMQIDPKKETPTCHLGK